MIKLEEGKYYRTADGRKVGPVRIAEMNDPDKWAFWTDGSNVYEVVGVPRECAVGTKIVAEWTDEPKRWRDMTDAPSEHNLSDYVDPIKAIIAGIYQEPKLWRDMSDEEKGALLLAHHEGKVIECWFDDFWITASPDWAPYSAYRVRPEPKRKVVKCWWDGYNIESLNNGTCTHRITFDTIDGEPDTSSIKMEKL